MAIPRARWADESSSKAAMAEQVEETPKTTGTTSVLPQAQQQSGRWQAMDEDSAVIPVNMIASSSKLSPIKSASKSMTIRIPGKRKTAKEVTEMNATSKPNAGQNPTNKVDKGKQRMRAEDDVLPQNTMETGGGTERSQVVISIPASKSTLKGKKRAREDDDAGDGQPKKRGRKPNSVSASASKPIKSTPSKPRGKKATVIRGVKWKTLLQEFLRHGMKKEPNDSAANIIQQTDLRPRIWTNNRKELLAMMPEMTGSTCLNGVSWALYETPLILLDDFNPCFEIDRDGKDMLSLDLVTTRAFACPAPSEVELERSKIVMNGSPPSAFEEPINIDAEQKFKARRRAPRYKSPQLSNPSRINSGIPRVVVDDPSNEIPTITFEVDTAALSSSSGVDASCIPDTIKLEPNPALEYSIQTLAAQDVPSPGTSSITHALPTAHNRPLMPRDPGLIAEFLDTAIETLVQAIPRASSESRDIPVDELQETPRSPFWKYVYETDIGSGRTARLVAPFSPTTALTEMEELYSISANNSPNIYVTGRESGQTAMPADFSVLSHEVEQELRLPSGPSSISQPSDHYATHTISNVEIEMLDQPALNQHNAGEKSLPSIPRTDLIILEPMEALSPVEHVSSDDIPLADIRPALGFRIIKADEGIENMVLLNPEDGIAIKAEAIANSRIPMTGNEESLTEYVPSPIPEELQAMIDSYLFGRPLTVMASNAYMQEHWSLKLPDEYGYAMLGYFRILGVQETRIPAESQLGSSWAGQVQWTFHLKWAPGGEKYLLPERTHPHLEHPWWNPPPLPPPPSTEEYGDHAMDDVQTSSSTTEEIEVSTDAGELEDSFSTTERYRDARKRHHEYKFRKRPLDDLYHSVIPLHLLIPFGPRYLDSSLPKGWLCADCGRINFQAALRHRKCLSSFCKEKPPPVASYAQDLFLLRDPQEQLPLSVPLNVYPKWLTNASVEKFECGIQTFSYHLDDNPNVFMKHIFTSNAPPLQNDASNLLRDIQINVPLYRPHSESSPYFFWADKSPKDMTAPTDVEWPHIPPCMNEAKKFLVSRIRLFSGLQDEQFSINRLKILAWITAGTKKSTDHIHAKTKSVAFCALGCTVVLVINPGSLKGVPALNDYVHPAESSRLPEALPDNEVADAQEDVASGWIAELPADADEVAEDAAASPKKAKTVPKTAKPNFTVMLMHGDILVLYGDEFEYSVKRDGTSLRKCRIA